MKITDQSQVGHTPCTGSHDQFSPEPPPPTKPHKSTENLQQVPDKPNESQPSNCQIYTAKISATTSAFAEKASSVKKVVASKHGYGRNDKGTETKTDTSEKPAGITDYGRKITSLVTEKLALEYEKVAGAGSAVAAKMHGAEGERKGSDTDVKVAETERGVKRSDKGVSVREYMAEKVRPGAEDKALSEIISDALHKRKENAERESDQQETKVDSISDTSVGPGMVGRMKGAVNLLFGKGGQSHGMIFNHCFYFVFKFFTQRCLQRVQALGN